MVYIKETFEQKVERNQKNIVNSKLYEYLDEKTAEYTVFGAADLFHDGCGRKKTRETLNSRQLLTKSINFLLKNNQKVVNGYEISMFRREKPPLYTAKPTNSRK